MKKTLLLIILSILTTSSYSQSFDRAITIGLTKKNAVPVSSFSSNECSYYFYDRKTKNYQFDKRYKSKRSFVFTTNPLLMYIYDNGSLSSDCFCEERGYSLVFDCEYDYIKTMIYVTTPNDFLLKMEKGNLYMYYNKNFWGTYKNLIVYEDIDSRKF